jgi:cytochrome d ubiquinol oxidase subunit I
VLISVLTWLSRKKIADRPLILKLLVWTIPLPYIASELGWTVAEVGRQPWIVYGLMKTSDASSPVAISQVLTSFISFTVAYGFLGVVAFYLIARSARSEVA